MGLIFGVELPSSADYSYAPWAVAKTENESETDSPKHPHTTHNCHNQGCGHGGQQNINWNIMAKFWQNRGINPL